MTIKVIKTNAELSKAIKSIETRGKTLIHDIQACGIDVCRHLDAHGDTTMLNKLFLAMEGQRTAAFAAWLLAFAPVKANTSKTKDVQPFLYDKDRPWQEELAMVNKWWTMGAPEKDPSELFDLYAKLKSIAGKAAKAKLENKLPPAVADSHIESLNQLIAAMAPTTKQ